LITTIEAIFDFQQQNTISISLCLKRQPNQSVDFGDEFLYKVAGLEVRIIATTKKEIKHILRPSLN